MDSKSEHTPIYSIDDYKNIFLLNKKTAIVTGAVGHLGSEISKALASHGANVILIGRTEKSLKAFVEKNNDTFDNRFKYYVCDVTNDIEFKKIVEDVHSKFGTIDILVNCAFNEERKEFLDITKDEWNNGMNNIVTHVVTCCQAVIPKMISNGSGSIINISSINGFLGIDQRRHTEVKASTVYYSTGKGALLNLTKRLATEYASKGIRVNSISPGFFPKPPKDGSPGRPGYIIDLSHDIPMKRVGKSFEISGVSIFLASEASSYVNGQNIIVDGGFSSW